MELTFNVDTRRMVLALNVAREFSAKGKTNNGVAQLIKSAAFWTCVKAAEFTPFVSAAQIDAELGTIVSPAIGKRGKPLSLNKPGNRIYSSSTMVTPYRQVGRPLRNMIEHLDMKMGRRAKMPLAAAIIQAAVFPGKMGVPLKRFNVLTNKRWMRPMSPYAGVPRAAGRAAMRQAVSNLIKKRRSSSKFLASGWHAAARRIRSLLYGGRPPLDTLAGRVPDGAGDGWYDAANHTATIRNLIGTQPGKRGSNAANYNRALHELGGPALQRALDWQAGDMIRHYREKVGRELARRFNALAS